MKKVSLFFASLLFLPAILFSQNRVNYPWKIKFSGGYTASGIAGKDAKGKANLQIASFFAFIETTNTRAGKRLQGGNHWTAEITREINQNLEIGIGMGITNQGGYARIDTLYSGYQFRDPMFTQTAGKGKDVFKFRYLIIPATIYIHPIKQYNFYFLAGGWYANIQSAKESVNFSSNSIDPRDNAYYEKDLFQTTKHDNWGISAGAGYGFPLSKTLQLSTEIMYSRGLVNVIKKDKINKEFTSGNIQSLNASVAFSFAF